MPNKLGSAQADVAHLTHHLPRAQCEDALAHVLSSRLARAGEVGIEKLAAPVL